MPSGHMWLPWTAITSLWAWGELGRWEPWTQNPSSPVCHTVQSSEKVRLLSNLMWTRGVPARKTAASISFSFQFKVGVRECETCSPYWSFLGRQERRPPSTSCRNGKPALMVQALPLTFLEKKSQHNTNVKTAVRVSPAAWAAIAKHDGPKA